MTYRHEMEENLKQIADLYERMQENYLQEEALFIARRINDLWDVTMPQAQRVSKIQIMIRDALIDAWKKGRGYDGGGEK